MKTNDNQHYIYLRSTRERIPCTEQEFHDYYRDIDTFRKKQQRHGRCMCPTAKRLDCDMDCVTCPFSRAGDTLSLDYTTTNDKGDEKSWLDDMPDMWRTAIPPSSSLGNGSRFRWNWNGAKTAATGTIRPAPSPGRSSVPTAVIFSEPKPGTPQTATVVLSGNATASSKGNANAKHPT